MVVYGSRPISFANPDYNPKWRKKINTPYMTKCVSKHYCYLHYSVQIPEFLSGIPGNREYNNNKKHHHGLQVEERCEKCI